MSDLIRSLAGYITLKKATDRKFVLMLCAGASFSSGVKTTDAITRELVTSYGIARPGSTRLCVLAARGFCHGLRGPTRERITPIRGPHRVPRLKTWQRRKFWRPGGLRAV